jgi:hypothetical protein
MYVEIRPHFSKTRGLRVRSTSGRAPRRFDGRHPTSPQARTRAQTRPAPSEWLVPAIHRGTAPSSKKSEVFPTGRVVAWPPKGHRRLNASSSRLSGLVPTIHPLLPGLGPMSANPIDLDARRSCPNLEARSGRPRRWSTDPARHSYYQWARQRHLARRLLGR